MTNASKFGLAARAAFSRGPSLAAALLWIGAAACAPKIYVVDRQTVLEQEAAGDWPEFDKELIAKSLSRGPAPLGKTAPSPQQRRLYNVPNGDLLKGSSPVESATAPKGGGKK